MPELWIPTPGDVVYNMYAFDPDFPIEPWTAKEVVVERSGKLYATPAVHNSIPQEPSILFDPREHFRTLAEAMVERAKNLERQASEYTEFAARLRELAKNAS